MNYDVTYAKSNDEIDIVELARIVWSHRYIVVTTTALVTILAIVYALTVTPVYRAQTVITEVQTGGRAGGAESLLGEFGGLAELAGINLGSTTANVRHNGRILIQSRTFAEEFIQRHGLLPIIFAEDYNETTNTWNTELETVPTLPQGAYVLQEAYELTFDSESGLLTLAVEWTDPKLAAQFANGMVSLANEIARERDIESAERSIEYLNEQIRGTNVIELQRVLYNLLETEQKTLMLANARDEYVFRVVDPALEPITRFKPNRRLIAVLGLVVGGALGLTFVVILRVIRKARSPA